MPVYENPLQSYDPEDFLCDVVEFARNKIDEVDLLQKPQRRLLWDKLIKYLEKERDEL